MGVLRWKTAGSRIAGTCGVIGHANKYVAEWIVGLRVDPRRLGRHHELGEQREPG